MNRTLQQSFSLKNAYRVNSILYSIKQIPLVRRALPDTLYQVRGLKIFANVLSVIWELFSIFIGKLLYFLIMVAGAASLYGNADQAAVFVHILFFLTLIGAFANTYMFNPTRDKYYAMFLMRMNAREYTLIHYAYAIARVFLGFAVCGTLFGMLKGLAVWQCLLIPFFVAGMKVTAAAWYLYRYERYEELPNENNLDKTAWILMALLLGLTYGLPAAGLILPQGATAALMLLPVLSGALSLRRILRFPYYREVYQQVLTQSAFRTEEVKQASKTQANRFIADETGITSSRKGYEYLNELFIKRHRRLLWKASLRIAAVCLVLTAAALIGVCLVPEAREVANRMILTWLPYFVFILYSINRGTGFTTALFMNCDHSLLTYSFYKQPAHILKLFRIRLREIVKINLVPAAILGAGLALLLFVSGGTQDVLNYVVLIVSLPCMSIFFSVHYLTIYYLLQPYNAGTEIKSGTYRLIMMATYLVCFYLMRLKMPTLLFGIMTIVFCILYSVIACVLVYRYAPKTFRLRA